MLSFVHFASIISLSIICITLLSPANSAHADQGPVADIISCDPVDFLDLNINGNVILPGLNEALFNVDLHTILLTIAFLEQAYYEEQGHVRMPVELNMHYDSILNLLKLQGFGEVELVCTAKVVERNSFVRLYVVFIDHSFFYIMQGKHPGFDKWCGNDYFSGYGWNPGPFNLSELLVGD
jgi:hypothetical protein